MGLSVKAVDLILWVFSQPTVPVPMSHAEEVPNIRAWAQDALAPHMPKADAPPSGPVPSPAPPSVTRPRRK